MRRQHTCRSRAERGLPRLIAARASGQRRGSGGPWIPQLREIGRRPLELLGGHGRRLELDAYRAVGRGHAPGTPDGARAELAAARSHAREEIAALPEELRRIEKGASGVQRKLVASDGLVREIERLVAEAR